MASVQRPVAFGRYLLLDRISVGGMAEVFKGRAFGVEGFARFVAIKRILPHLAEDRRFVEMFITEAKVAVQLSHANIAQVYELGRQDADHYIAMEYVSGKDLLSLHHTLKRTGERLPVALTAFIGARVAEGLGYAHRKRGQDGRPMGIVHRDISPQNVLVSYDGAVKLIDFGIAKARIRSYEETQAGVLKGKFGYMSPEQIIDGDVDPRSDIFALGTVLHELLTGKRLFFGDNDFLTLELVREADVPPPSSLNPEVPAELDAILLRALARERADRYQTAGELADDLARYLHQSGPGLSGKGLADWMRTRFAEDLAEEKQRDEAWRQFALTPDGEVVQVDPEEDEATALWNAPFDTDDGAQLPAWLRAETSPDPLDELPALVDAPTGRSPARRFEAPSTGTGALLDLPTGRRETRRGRREWVLAAALLAIAVAAGFGLFRLLSSDPAPAEPTGLIVRTEPAEDVTIYIDGRLVGERSPIVVRDLAQATHEVRVDRAGYQSFQRSVTLDGPGLRPIDARLVPVESEPARLRFVTRPADADVYVDGRLIDPGVRNRGLELPSGRPVDVSARREGFRTLAQRVVPEAGASRTLTLTLKPTPGTLIVDSEPPGDVYLDGKRVGRTPFTQSDLDVSRPWRVEVRRPGRPVWRETLRFGEKRFLQVDLDTKR
ncbi:MAG: serine/threonine protein kinase [Myxococcales bacterium]|nr:serine/threonine protein kinase [Myxococcales bacterium]